MNKSPQLCFARVLTIYRLMLANPNKIFVAGDVKMGREGRKYFKLLAALNIAEIVPVVYNCGAHYSVRRDVKGYKLKRETNGSNE